MKQPRPHILLDGIFFQLADSGIARVWRSLLAAWVESGFAAHVTLLDRSGSAPRIPGIRYRSIPPYDYSRTAAESQQLQRICDEEGADLFMSTYYTTPISTPSAFLVYDMIPEMLGMPLDESVWQEKQLAIRHASVHLAISRSSASDLERLFPEVPRGSTRLAYCGVDPALFPASDAEVAALRARMGLEKPYFLLVGERTGYDGYKNGKLFFRALAQTAMAEDCAVLCVGGCAELEEGFRQLVPETQVVRAKLPDAELRAAYSGAVALVYPSLYEGFGLPVVEAFACACPVITCRNSSLAEIAGDHALFVDENDPCDLAAKLAEIQDPSVRKRCIKGGLNRASHFTWAAMAEAIAAVLGETMDRLQDGMLSRPSPLWGALREFQRQDQEHVAALLGSNMQGRAAQRATEALHEQNRMLQENIHSLRLEIAAIKNSPFRKIQGATTRMLLWFRLRSHA